MNKRKKKNTVNKTGSKSGVAIAYSDTQSFRQVVKGGTRIRNSEFLSSIAGSTLFASNEFNINPGLTQVFPWLSGEASKWQQYRFHRLVFRYVPRCPTTTEGTIILAPEYDVREGPPRTEVEATNTSGAKEDVVWKGLTCPIDIPSAFSVGNRKFIRDGVVVGNLTTYDTCKFYASTIGMIAGAAVVGKLWVDYDIEFFVPQTKTGPLRAPSCVALFYNDAPQSLGSLVNFAEFDTVIYNALGITQPSNHTFNLQPGYYCVDYMAQINFAATIAIPWDSCAVAFVINDVLVIGTEQILSVTTSSINTMEEIISCMFVIGIVAPTQEFRVILNPLTTSSTINQKSQRIRFITC